MAGACCILEEVAEVNIPSLAILCCADNMAKLLTFRQLLPYGTHTRLALERSHLTS